VSTAAGGRAAGRPDLLIATHNLQFIAETCDRAALLVEGRAAFVGKARKAVRRYRRLLAGEGGEVPQGIDGARA
jgi:ABC-type polysaccharide/polyol phosphate transport system ATPase subunit